MGIDILADHAGGDANGAREVLTSPMYRRFLPKMNLEQPVNVLDLGANNGGFPLLLLACDIDLKKVVSVEFNPRTFSRLSFNLLRNFDHKAVPVNAALCGSERSIQIALGSGGVSDNIYEQDNGPAAKTFNIQGITLNDLYDAYFKDEIIDICKIDVEGAEFEVFRESNHTRIEQCRYVIMEIHEDEGRKADEIIDVLSSLGFERRETEEDADPTVHFFVNSRFGRPE